MSYEQPNRRRGPRGMTLVEVMISMAIFSVVMAGVMGALIENQQQVLMHGRIADMQTSMRTAVTQLERTLELAGYGIDPNYALEPVVLDAAGNDTAAIRDGIGPYGNDELVVHYRDPLFRRVISAANPGQLNLATPMNPGETLERGQRLLVLCASGGASAYVTVLSVAGSPVNVINLLAGAAAPFNQEALLTPGSCFTSGTAVVLRVERRHYFVAFINELTGGVRPALLVRRGVDADGNGAIDVAPNCVTAPFISCNALNDAEVVALDVEQLQVAYGLNQPQRCIGGVTPGCTNIAAMWGFGAGCSGGPCGPDGNGNWIYGDQPGTSEVPRNSLVASVMWSGSAPAPTPLLRPPLLGEVGTICAGLTMTTNPNSYCGYGGKRRYTGHPGNVRMVRFTIGARTARAEARLALTRMADLPTEPMENLTTAQVGSGACAAASGPPWTGPQCSRHVRSRLTGTVSLKNMMQRSHFVPPVGANGNVDGG